MRRSVDDEARDLLADTTGQRIEQLDRIDLVIEELDAHRKFGMLRGEDVDRVAAHPERATREVGVVALVLHRHQPLQQVALGDPVPHAHHLPHVEVITRIADAVDAGDAADDDGVTPLEQGLGRRQPHLLDVLVDRRVLLDEQVALRDVGLGLVVVVVRDEVFDGIVREEFAHLGIELRRQRLVRGEHQRRPAQPGDDVGHRVGLARPGYAQQCLVGQAVTDALDQAFDGGRLVTGRRKGLEQLERAAFKGDELAFAVRSRVADSSR